MNTSLHAALEHVRAHEGGYVHHPRDPGGCTNMGITLETYRARVSRHATCADLRALTWGAAAQIYRDGFWDPLQGDALPAGVDLLAFDHAVTSGPQTAARILQRVLNVAADGIVGPVTLAAAAKLSPSILIARYTDARMSFYRNLKTWPVFGRGWQRRTEAARALALSLVH